MKKTCDYSGRVGFAVGTGRCGTQFLSRLAEREPAVASWHEREPYTQSFHRYCQWYGVPADEAGYVQEIRRGIDLDLAEYAFSFESSAFLSLSITTLYQQFDARFVLMCRSPEAVVNSFHKKGWYADPLVCDNPELPLGVQPHERFYHFLCRFAPSGEKFKQFQGMTRIGKLAWYWNALNQSVLDQFDQLPDTHKMTQKLEEMSFERYAAIGRFCGFETALDEEGYQQLSARRPNAFSDLRTVEDWSEQEISEFESEVAPMAQRLGYEYRVAELIAERRGNPPPPRTATPKSSGDHTAPGQLRSLLSRGKDKIKRAVAKW